MRKKKKQYILINNILCDIEDIHKIEKTTSYPNSKYYVELKLVGGDMTRYGVIYNATISDEAYKFFQNNIDKSNNK